MTLGDILKQYREQNDISMEEFSKRSSLSKGYISMLENNINPRSSKPIAPTLPTIQKIANGMNIDIDTLLKTLDSEQEISLDSDIPASASSQSSCAAVLINVLGRVAAGIPLNAIEEVIDTEEISQKMASDGEYFALKISGDSMEPKISNGDVVIVRKQPDAEDGNLVIAMVNGYDAVCKRLKKYKEGIALISNNPAYEPMYFSNKDIIEKPVTILGVVKELRAKF